MDLVSPSVLAVVVSQMRMEIGCSCDEDEPCFTCCGSIRQNSIAAQVAEFCTVVQICIARFLNTSGSLFVCLTFVSLLL